MAGHETAQMWIGIAGVAVPAAVTIWTTTYAQKRERLRIMQSPSTAISSTSGDENSGDDERESRAAPVRIAITPTDQLDPSAQKALATRRVVTWLVVGYSIFLVAYRPQSAAEIFKIIGSGFFDIAQGLGDFVSSLVA